jgi:hypothetical protein
MHPWLPLVTLSTFAVSKGSGPWLDTSGLSMLSVSVPGRPGKDPGVPLQTAAAFSSSALPG